MDLCCHGYNDHNDTGEVETIRDKTQLHTRQINNNNEQITQ